MSEPAKNPLKLFYCYAREDKVLRDTLDSHLISLKRQKLIEIWYDGKISAGTELACGEEWALFRADL